MAEIPHPWEAYARLQHKLSSTWCITAAAGLEEALNVVLQPDFSPKALTEDDLLRVAASAGRRDRHRAQLLRQAAAAEQDGCPAATLEPEDAVAVVGAPSLDDEVHARRELARLEVTMREPDWDVLTGVASGISYAVLAAEHACTEATLRSRVCRLRRLIG